MQLVTNYTLIAHQRRSTMEIHKNDTAVLITDPQNDFLSEKGVTWDLVGDSVKENKTVENIMHEIKMFNRSGALNLDGFSGSGADWLERYKSFIEDGKTIVVSPHKVYGPENNDLILQLRKRNISKIILGGMSANLCVEAHMRELLEQGFEVAVVKDATAGARHPELGDGYKAALVNFGYIANAVLSTDEVVKFMDKGMLEAA